MDAPNRYQDLSWARIEAEMWCFDPLNCDERAEYIPTFRSTIAGCVAMPVASIPKFVGFIGEEWLWESI